MICDVLEYSLVVHHEVADLRRGDNELRENCIKHAEVIPWSDMVSSTPVRGFGPFCPLEIYIKCKGG